MWQAQIFTLYPEIFPGPLNKGLYGKALLNKTWDLKVINIRDAAEDKHKKVDDTPFGGGSGMLLKADVLAKSIDQNQKKGERIFYLSPKGKKLDQKLALELSKEKSIKECLELANKVAGISTTKLGAGDAMPFLKDIQLSK